VEQLGGESFIYLSTTNAEQEVVAKIPGQSTVLTGDIVGLITDLTNIYAFDVETGVCIKSPGTGDS
ncbi:MAG: hypothetical protein ACKVIA_17150, partial [Rhodobacterales bacterium]